MINKNLFKKSLTFTIVVLLFGTGFLPIINGDAERIEYDSEFKVNDFTPEESFLDAQYIYNITKALSDIIFTEYNESASELAKGRFAGTKGEWRAAEILYDNMTKLGLWTTKEQIRNTPAHPDLTHMIQVLDYGLKVNNETIADFHIVPSEVGPRENRNQLDYNFSFKGLKVKRMPEIRSPWTLKDLFSDEKRGFCFHYCRCSVRP